MILHEEISDKYSEDDLIIRASDAHRSHLHSREVNAEVASIAYGVVAECTFEQLPYFDTTTSFPPDVMHDILEGVIPLLLRQLLLTLHSRQIVSVQNINTELDLFSFGQNDKKGKPVKLSLKHLNAGTFPGTAIQKWCMFNFLPFLIGHFVPTEDEHWQHYLLFREIVDFVMSPVVKKSSLSHLQILIGEFLSEFNRLYPGNFIPKLHYLVHYPRLLAEFGPLRSLWCLRFEGKHQYFKRLARNVCNFRNICFTLAKRHQQRQCWDFCCADALHQSYEQEGSCVVQLSSTSLKDIILEKCNIQASELEADETILKVKKLTVDHVKYEVKDYFIVDVVHEDLPIFFKILHIIQFRCTWILCGKLYFGLEFNSHLHAFKIEALHEWCTLTAGNEVDYHALDAYEDSDGCLYIAPHHTVYKVKK
ncbi:uncharacterized protein LOC131738084 [Acipenser ruthenus]|uniref:uncharacterized protein LOC131738084 n=1 Tax=Acipenser ruthenus TaxID=7906 RepID=UPI002741CBEA|nr:uncharacterized protein LOC131738084 [Acipenser ruthenus]